MKEELQFKVIATIQELTKQNVKLKEENDLLKEKLNDLRNNSIQNKMSEYDELICELDEQKKEYVGLIHDVKKLKMQLQSELLKIMQVLIMK